MIGFAEAAELILLVFAFLLLLVGAVEMIREERRPEAHEPLGQFRVGSRCFDWSDDE